MVTHGGENAVHLKAALASLANQSLQAEEVVLVCSGPLPAHQTEVIRAFKAEHNLIRVDLKQNRALGISLKKGLSRTSNEWVARMDSDDICAPDRFEKQFRWLESHPDTDILGTAIDEFTADPAHPVSRRDVPLTHEDIAASAFQRTPFNHMTVVYRKSAVLAAGSYRNFLGYEDFDLWTRMLVAGVKMANLEEVLVHARIGNGFHSRRGGWRYARAEWRALGTANAINPGNRLAVNLLRPVRFVMRLMPSRLRSAMYGLVRRRT